MVSGRYLTGAQPPPPRPQAALPPIYQRPAFRLPSSDFRSTALKATLGFLFSLAAVLGAVVAVFQWGWLASLIGVDAPGPILSFLPIILIGLLFGLAMDYEVFLVTRMRERHIRGAAPRDAIRYGFEHAAPVVTAAAVIMIAVFSGFIVGDDPVIKSIGFALALGVLLDAFVVRMTLVPAILALLGRSAWWLPAWLDRALPAVDVEGSSLQVETPRRTAHGTGEPQTAAAR